MKKKYLAIMSILIFLMINLLNCSSKDEKVEDTASSTQTITLAMVSVWDTLLPFDTTSAYSDLVSDLIFDKLFYLKADGTYYGRLAESWEISDDNKEFIINLNTNAKWHDGKEVTAQDVVFTSKLYASPTMAAIRAVNLEPVKGYGESDDSLEVEAIDKYRVKFTFSKPTNIDFIIFNKFRDTYILPSHILGDIPLDEIRKSDYWKNPIGSGPCIYKSQISGERIEFIANKNYHLSKPSWDRFVVRVVQTSNLLSGLINGEIDILAGNVASLQLSDWDMAKQQENLESISTESLGYQYMSINTQREYLPKKVRQAINIAINRSLIVEGLLKGEGEEAYGPLSKSHKYYNDGIEVEYSVDRAKQLLSESGWDENNTLIMTVPSGNNIREQAAVIIQQNLQDVGINTKIVTSDFPTHLNRIRKGDYDLGLIGSGGSPDPSESITLLKPGNINNFSQLKDSNIADIGEKGELIFNFTDRKKAYDEYQLILKEEVPFCFLYFQNSLFAYNKRIKNITDTEDTSQHNRDVWNWAIAE